MKTYSFFEMLAFAFIVESVIYLIFLFKSPLKRGNFFLILFISILIFLIINIFYSHLIIELPYLYFEGVLLAAPLQYLYVKSVVDREFVLSRLHFLHLLGLIFGVFLRFVLTYIFGESLELTIGKYLAFYLFIFTYTYLFFSIRNINTFHRVILSTQSNYDIYNLKWLKYEIIILGVLFLSLGAESLSLFIDLNNNYYYVILLAFVSLLVFINILIFKSLKSPVLTSGIAHEEQILFNSDLAKYKSSRIKPVESKAHYMSLINLINDKKPFREYELSLNKLSKMINLSPVVLSQVINENSKMNFNDFINNYRVEEAKKLLDSEEELLVKEIMFFSGFQATSTFNSSFKKKTGLSPTAYRKRLKKAFKL